MCSFIPKCRRLPFLVQFLLQPRPGKVPDALGLAEQVLHRRVAQTAEQLHAVHV